MLTGALAPRLAARMAKGYKCWDGVFLGPHIPLAKVNSDRIRGHRIEVGCRHVYSAVWGKDRLLPEWNRNSSIPNGVRDRKCES